MKNKVILIVAIVIGVTIAGRALMLRRRPGAQDSDEDTVIDDAELEKYEDLRSGILDLIDELDAEAVEAIQPDDELSIELFDLDPENEELGEIY
jgi:hypothetical protein